MLSGAVLQEVMATDIKVEMEEDNDPLLPFNCQSVEMEGNDGLCEVPSEQPMVTRHKENSMAKTAVANLEPKTTNFICQYCKVGFRFNRSFRWHQERCKAKRIHDEQIPSGKDAIPGRGKKIKQCKICGKSFIGKSLKMHYINLHFKTRIEMDYLGESTKKCPICKSVFKKQQGLTTHIGYIHKVYLKYLREYDASHVAKGRKVSCGECTKCKRENCGNCAHCYDKPEFGGPGKLMKVCVRKVCRNKQISEAVIKPTLVRKNFIDRKKR